MKVNEIMTNSVVKIHPEESVQVAARTLQQHNIGFLPVCGANGQLCGLVTDRDLITRCVAANLDPANTAVRDVMTYIEQMENGGQIMTEVQEISHRERAAEYLMMNLRTVHGIDPAEYEERYRLPFRPLERLFLRCQKEGLAARSYEGRWYLTPTGFLVSNSILSDLLLLQERSRPIK